MDFIETTLSEDDYKNLVLNTFGEYRPHLQHNVVQCRDDEVTVMIFNYFDYSIKRMFLHQVWLSNECKKKTNKLRYWLGFFSYAKERGYKQIMGVIHSQNKQAIIWSLKTGFDIVGVRQEADNSLIVDVIKVL